MQVVNNKKKGVVKDVLYSLVIIKKRKPLLPGAPYSPMHKN